MADRERIVSQMAQMYQFPDELQKRLLYFYSQ